MATEFRKTNPRRNPQPANHRVARARWMRWTLLQLLGAKCVECGEDNLDQLEFDHLVPRDWEPRRLNRWQRMRRYWIDWEHSRLTLRCRKHNAAKGYPDGQLALLEAMAARRNEKAASEPF